MVEEASIWYRILVIAPPFAFAVILHEVAHGWVAERLGDPTARQAGRISLNPIVHVDWMLTVALPAMLIFFGSPIVFGGAKPVPVDPRYFFNPRRGMLWVALAGPVTNFVLAGGSFLLLLGGVLTLGLPEDPNIFLEWLRFSILINLVLGIFNLIPIPPLDGGRIAVGLLPLSLAKNWAKLERFGLIIVVLLWWVFLNL